MVYLAFCRGKFPYLVRSAQIKTSRTDLTKMFCYEKQQIRKNDQLGHVCILGKLPLNEGQIHIGGEWGNES